MFVFLMSQVAFAAEITIQPSGTNDALYSAIRSSSSGDTIVLQKGLYQECVNTLGKDLHFRGHDGAQIVGNGSCSALLQVEDGEIWVENLTFSHKSTCIHVSGRTASLHVNNSSLLQCGNGRIEGGGAKIDGATLTIKSSKVSGNQAQKGAGVYAKNAVVSIEDTLFADNIAQIGGAIVGIASEVTVVNSRVLGNETKSGGMGAGIALRTGGYLTIRDSLLQGNHAQGKGGAIYLDTTSTSRNSLTLDTVRCTGNSSSFGSSTGGCLYSRGNAKIEVWQSRFVDNIAALSGGAIAIHDAGDTVHVAASVFAKNRARSGEGGAVLVETSSEKYFTPVVVTASEFENNRAETYGGALSLGNTVNAYANLEVTDSRFIGNTANSSQSGAGGAIYFVSQAPHTLRLTQTHFDQNKAELAGGAVYAVNPQMVWIQQSSFFNNSAKGASTFNPRYGGGVMLDGATVTFIEESKFCGNSATSTGGKRVSGTGGALYLQNSERLVFERNWIWENEAQEVGGGIALDEVRATEMADSIFAANRSLKGGVVYMNNSSSTASNLDFAFTQAGAATMTKGTGSHQWSKINWYNNVDGNGNVGIEEGVPLSLTTFTEQNPNFSDLVVDNRCNDTLLSQ